MRLWSLVFLKSLDPRVLPLVLPVSRSCVLSFAPDISHRGVCIIFSLMLFHKLVQTPVELVPKDELADAVYASVKLEGLLGDARILQAEADPASDPYDNSTKDTTGRLSASNAFTNTDTNTDTNTSTDTNKSTSTNAHPNIGLDANASHSGLTGPSNPNASGYPTQTVARFYNNKTDVAAKETAQESGAAKDTAPKWRLRTLLAGAHQGWVRCVAVDPVSNAWFATGLADASVKVWDWAGSVRATISGHILGVRALAISPRYAYMFSGSEDKSVRCWDLERTSSPAGCQVRTYHGHVGGVYALALHPELDVLFSAGRDGAVRVWDMRTRAAVMVLTGHRGDVTSLAAQAADPQVCSAGMDGTVRLWDLRLQKTHLTLTQHACGVRALAMHPHESTMATADANGIKQWVLPGGELLAQFGGLAANNGAPDPAGNIVNTLAINPASNELVAGHADGALRFYDYESGARTFTARSVPAQGADRTTIYAASFDMLGLRLVTAESDKAVKIWAPDVQDI